MDNSECSLSIGIPTFARPDALLRRIAECRLHRPILQQILICDNSPGAVLPPDSDHWDSFVNYNLNAANIGGGANFLRLIEYSQTTYIWWRGDDDPITQNQIDAVKANMAANDVLLLLSPFETEVFEGIGLESFIDNFDKIQVIGWLSCIVLPSAIAKQALRWGYAGVGTGWANVCLVLGMFREFPGLRFRVIPIELKEGDFRESGEGAMRWAFFNTCLQNFPNTSLVIESAKLRQKYLDVWRATQHFSLIGTMLRLKLGLTCYEKITYKTFAPLVSIRNPRTTFLAATLYCISKLPAVFVRLGVSIVWPFFGTKIIKRRSFAFLKDANSIRDVYRRLSSINPGQKVETFL